MISRHVSLCLEFKEQASLLFIGAYYQKQNQRVNDFFGRLQVVQTQRLFIIVFVTYAQTILWHLFPLAQHFEK